MNAAPLQVTPAEAFLEALWTSGALTTRQLSVLSDLSEPRDIGRVLLERGWMTVFQVNQVHRGQGQNLMVGPYLLLERLGKGGMGEVFKARHVRMRRTVALKLVRPARRARFLREIEVAARLDHPNVVRAYDAGELAGDYYLVMEYVEGEDLDRLVQREGPLDPLQVCDYARQAALGLQHAFERGVVHRDLKPSNLLLSSQDALVKVLDLGLARLAEPEDDRPEGPLTRKGQILGSVDFMAPEQAKDSRSADTRADLYSLGCTMYFLLTGRLPFPGGSPLQRLMRHLNEEPESLESLRPGLPSQLVVAVRRLMAKRPEDRFQTPAELAQFLTRNE